MKVVADEEEAVPVPHFISHMVQMKVIIYIVYRLKKFNLYIPHGSDESD